MIKKIFGSENFRAEDSEKNIWSKKFWAESFSVKKNFWSKKFLGQKIFWSKYFGSKKVVGQKKNWVEKYFG